MKKKILLMFIGVFTFMLFTNVQALDITQSVIDDACTNTPDTDIGGLICHMDGEDKEIILLPGTHSLSEDVTVSAFKFFSEGDTTLNLNNHTLTGEIIVSNNNSLTINGEGTVTGSVTAELGNITINKGTYNNGILMLYGKLIITDATVDSGTENMAIGLADATEAVISGGTYTGTMIGLGADKEAGLENVKSITITGGTFTGGMAGLLLYSDDIDSIEISGGTFTGGVFSINIVNNSEAKANSVLTDILADGYTYSPDMTFGVEHDPDEDIWATYTNQKELTVVPDEGGDTPEPDTPTDDSGTTTNNPPTVDNIFLYITLLVISLIGLTTTSLYMKKSY